MDQSLKTVDESRRLMEIAVQLHQAGKLAAARQAYAAILARNPEDADALRLLGVVAAQEGRADQAVELISRAISLRPQFAMAMGNLGNALQALGRLDEAIDWHRKETALDPRSAEACNNLGNALRVKGAIEESIAWLQRAVALGPNLALAHRNLGAALRKKGDLDAAASSLRRSLELNPNDADAHNFLGLVLASKDKPREAIEHYRRAIELLPKFAEAYCNLGDALSCLRDPDQAIECFGKSIELKSDLAAAHHGLGQALKDSGLIPQAIESFRRAMSLNPASAQMESDFLLAIHYDPAATPAEILRLHRLWEARHAPVPAPPPAWTTRDRDPHRRIRVGYVSADFKQHVSAVFVLPLLAAHDRKAVEIFIYANVPQQDQTTHAISKQADQWHEVFALEDQAMADLIRRDQIDILVDLSVHSPRNRLPVFARKPAPSQISWLGCASTTGLAAMDYRLSDPYLDPPGSALEGYCEETIRLPQTYWCYQPLIETPAPGPPPLQSAGHVTFGCLNSFCKVGRAVLEAWCELMRSVPNSRLVLHAPEGSCRQRTLDLFHRAGVDAERVRFVGRVSLGEYFSLYHAIDIALDPFPFNGATTTFDALWMGVPVVSFIGPTAAGRGGLSILSNVDLPHLVGKDLSDYLRIARDLAADAASLAGLRATLRQRMLDSPVMDAPRFARNLEAIYRQIWQKWCGQPAA